MRCLSRDNGFNVFSHIREQIDTVFKRDPAARSVLEIVLCYPGFHALLFYRLAHFLWRKGWLVLGRFVLLTASEYRLPARPHRARPVRRAIQA